MRKVLGLLFILIWISSCGINSNLSHEVTGLDSMNFYKVNLNDLVNLPAKYHQSNIEVTGLFTCEFENVALYESQSSKPDKAVWVDFNKRLNISEEDLKRYDKHSVTIKGEFNSNYKGHLNRYKGLLNVYSISLL